MSDPDVMTGRETSDPTGSTTPSGDVSSRTAGSDAWASLRGSWTFWIAVVLITALAILAAVPQLFTDVKPDFCQASLSRQPPSSEAWFGYTQQGCDVFSRTIYGARASLIVGFLATLFALVLGAGAGVYAGFFGGIVDAIISRIIDLFTAMPILLGSIIILSLIPTPEGATKIFTILKVALVIAVLGWTSTARVARSAVLQVKQADYVSASRSLGASRSWMIRKHVIPNAAAPVIVVTTLSLGSYIGAEATLSFLGIGLQAPVISWGIDINDASTYVRTTPHMLLFPAIFLGLTVLAFISLGEAVREALDPKAASLTKVKKGEAIGGALPTTGIASEEVLEELPDEVQGAPVDDTAAVGYVGPLDPVPGATLPQRTTNPPTERPGP